MTELIIMYRLVSLLSVVSNIMERCIYYHIYSFVSKDISEKQHVFRVGQVIRSCFKCTMIIFFKLM